MNNEFNKKIHQAIRRKTPYILTRLFPVILVAMIFGILYQIIAKQYSIRKIKHNAVRTEGVITKRARGTTKDIVLCYSFVANDSVYQAIKPTKMYVCSQGRKYW